MTDIANIYCSNRFWTNHPIDQLNYLRYICNDKNVIDLGCGDGSLLVDLKDNGAQFCIGIDKNDHLDRIISDKYKFINQSFRSISSLNTNGAILILSWPIIDDAVMSDAVRILSISNEFIVMGRIDKTTFCGHKSLWKYVVNLELIEYFYSDNLFLLHYSNNKESRRINEVESLALSKAK